jgi:sulfatase maturation enzyme AslB (radical SAM superfamily)
MTPRPAEAGPRSLCVVLTTGCNLRCSYCFQPRTAARRMDWSVLRATIDYLLRSPHDEVRLVFYGGEPLLQFPLMRRAVTYAEKVKPVGLAVRYGVITNGTLMTADIAEFLARHRVSTRLSFDGVSEVQALRGKSTFAVLDSLLGRLRREQGAFFRRDLRIQMTALPETLGHLAESVRYLIDTEVCEIDLGPCRNRDASWRPERITELDREMRSVFDLCLEHYHETGEIPLLPFRRDREDEPADSRGRAVCGIDRAESPAVDVDGQVHGCLALAESVQNFPSEGLRSKVQSLRLGEIGSPNLPRRLAGYARWVRDARIFHNKQERYSSYGRCRDCAYVSTCGVCPITIGCAAEDDDFDRVPDFICAFNLVTNRYRDRFPMRPSIEDRLAGRAPVPRLTQRLHEFAEASRRAKRR